MPDNTEPTKKEWETANAHLRKKIREYKSMIGNPKANPVGALAQLHKMAAKISQGDRSRALYNEIMKFQ